MPLSIRTERLTLCQWQPDHFPSFAEHLTDAQAMRFLGGTRSFSEASRIFLSLAGQWQLRGYGFYAVEHEGRFVGAVGIFHPYNWPEPELAYNFVSEVHGRGFATEAVRAVRNVAAMQGRERLVSFIDPENHASEAVARRLGAEPIGDTSFNAETVTVWRHQMSADAVPPRQSVGELEPVS